ncbi:MAG TPA: hypothetical protein VK509_05010 [Polyangiales bacterium]|nr:hypothetical protein [Polyangiales bacterium]
MNRLALEVTANLRLALDRTLQLALFAALGVGSVGLIACGDDDAVAASDAGDKDASPRAGTNGGTIGRRDAQVTARDPVSDCDPTEPVPCAAGQTCRPVIRRAAGESQFSLLFGCVEDSGGRARNAPCNPWGGLLVPYRADGLDDELYVDPCDEGLYCTSHPSVRGAFSCQESCPLGTCASSDQQCLGGNAIEAVCRDIDHCDPLTGGGCPSGQTCYLALDGAGTRVLTSCQLTPPEPLADGAACQFVGDCHAGSSCWGPPRLPPSRWTEETLLCRSTCNTMVAAPAGDPDAGGDEDGGVPGSCAGGTSCRALSASGVDVALLEDGFGQCE